MFTAHDGIARACGRATAPARALVELKLFLFPLQPGTPLRATWPTSIEPFFHRQLRHERQRAVDDRTYGGSLRWRSISRRGAVVESGDVQSLGLGASASRRTTAYMAAICGPSGVPARRRRRGSWHDLNTLPGAFTVGTTDRGMSTSGVFRRQDRRWKLSSLRAMAPLRARSLVSSVS